MNPLVDCGNGVRLERALPCELSDGTVLVSDHYYPAGEGPWPTLFMRQPYGRDIASTVVYAHPVWFAGHGYHVVIQDVRGRGGSGGHFYPFRHEARDGAESIAWLLRHPACNGGIGMYGFSYQGATQLLAAAEQPPGLVCIAPHMTAADLFQGWFYAHGALRLAATLGWGIQMLREDARRRNLTGAARLLEAAWIDVRSRPLHAPYGDLPELGDPGLPTYLLDWITHRQPGPYWTEQDISTRPGRILLPALHIAGWHDLYSAGSIDAYLLLRSRAGSSFARENQYLLAGPWVHIPWGDRIGDSRLGQEANFDTDQLLLRWFNHWLKDRPEFVGEPAIRYFSLGPNQWRSATKWPETPACALYLHSDGKANSRKGDGILNASAPISDEPRDVFVYDAEVPVAGPGGLQALSGLFDQSITEMGNNLLVYTSSAATADIEVLGHPRVTLHAVTSAPHADFTARLTRVTPDGRSEFLTLGIARSSFLFRDCGYAPDHVQTWSFPLDPIAFTLRHGERLRLTIASSAFPTFDRNPSTDTPPQAASPATFARSTQQLLHTPTHASALHLPLVGEAAW